MYHPPRNQPRLFKIWLRQVIFMFLFICLAVLVNVNETNASDPNLLTEIDLVNGGFSDLRWSMHISDRKDMVYETHKQTSVGTLKSIIGTMKTLYWIVKSNFLK